MDSSSVYTNCKKRMEEIWHTIIIAGIAELK